jgi:hypothetical protein
LGILLSHRGREVLKQVLVFVEASSFIEIKVAPAPPPAPLMKAIEKITEDTTPKETPSTQHQLRQSLHDFSFFFFPHIGVNR